MISADQRSRFSAALARLAGDEFVFLQVAEIARCDGPVLFEESREHLKAGEFEAAVKALHKLKGLMATFVDDSKPLGLDEVMAVAEEKDASAALEVLKSKERGLNELFDEIRELPKT